MMNVPSNVSHGNAADIAANVRSGKVKAREVAEGALKTIAALDPALNCFTAVLAERAIEEADAVDSMLARGEDPGPLAGVPFAVKNLFDIRGIPTLAGSKLRANLPPPAEDAAAIRSLRKAGAVLVGALNMDEFAYGFTTENSHYGATHNPHDLTRVAGGSSGGSAAAVAAGIVPITLGSDTNGSIRVPSAFCGVFGLKATYGLLSRQGAFPFVDSLDVVGPFARSVGDLRLAFEAMLEHRVASNERPLRIATAGGYFQQETGEDVQVSVRDVADALQVTRVVEIPEAARARAAAYVMTASEGGNLHLEDLRKQPDRFDPLVRNRLIAGALVPAAWVSFAQRFRSWFREQMNQLFREVDIILAPATPCSAIRIGQETICIDGKDVPSRPNIGVFTQPVSLVGLPVLTVPVHLPGRMPLGVQVIAAPFQEAKLFRCARELEERGVVAAPVAQIEVSAGARR
jgi:AtzE family amidohydrolase